MQQIGLYVHRIRVFENNERLELGSGPGQFDLRAVVNAFVNFHQNEAIVSPDRTSKLIHPVFDNEFASGMIRYGVTGIASEITNPEDPDFLVERLISFVEEIPLYYCIYTPDGEDTWYIATQSYGGRSCSTSFNKALFDYFRERHEAILQVQKMIPIDGNNVEHSPVQKLTMIRRAVPADEFEAQVGDLAHELQMQLSISVDGRGALGVYQNVRDRLSGDENVALAYNGIEFQELQATVRIGNSYRKVGIIGANNSAGSVDVSEEVERQANEHPEWASIDTIARQLCAEYLIQYRDQ